MYILLAIVNNRIKIKLHTHNDHVMAHGNGDNKGRPNEMAAQTDCLVYLDVQFDPLERGEFSLSVDIGFYLSPSVSFNHMIIT